MGKKRRLALSSCPRGLVAPIFLIRLSLFQGNARASYAFVIASPALFVPARGGFN